MYFLLVKEPVRKSFNRAIANPIGKPSLLTIAGMAISSFNRAIANPIGKPKCGYKMPCKVFSDCFNRAIANPIGKPNPKDAVGLCVTAFQSRHRESDR